jgi:5-methylcytosine-specific restriction endonuclease McrA
MTARRKSNGHRWRMIQARVYREEEICGLCRQPVDKSLPRKLPDGSDDLTSKSVDHIISVANGGDEYDRDNCQLAHLGCNFKKNKGYARAVIIIKRVRSW